MTERPLRLPGTDGYGDEAAVLVSRYESLSFDEVNRSFLPFIPAAPCRVLEIGAGTGRDAAALADRGHRVLAVEPTAELRREGQCLHPPPRVEWLDDGLPELAHVQARGERFDLVRMIAVWMHLDESERARALPRVASLLTPGGLMMLSLRHGPVPAGRRMFEVDPREVEELGRRENLRMVQCSRGNDAQGRTNVHWTFMVLRKDGG